MKACIVLNGEIADIEAIKDIIEAENYDCLICADGGANYTYEMGIVPDYILGDLDSTSTDVVDFYREKGVSFKKFPSHKDETDSELCIILAKELDADNIDFIGALGGRIDHTIGCIKLLAYTQEIGVYSRILTEKVEMYYLDSTDMILKGKAGDTISVLAGKGDAEGVTLESLKYPLDDYYMSYSKPIGISNVMLSDECRISVKNGSLYVVRNKFQGKELG
ncbi:MAG: thiamine diphosphokinase [Clostridioides sp.]|jgi:thiamine pyrophosphokinase|nr:thiamine diphosphokinase [Clostridioides sp.]